MGPECIIIEFKRKIQIECCIKIYGYTQKRQETIKKIINCLEIKDSKTDIDKKKTEIPYEKNPSSLGKAYTNLQLAYEHLFLEDQ